MSPEISRESSRSTAKRYTRIPSLDGLRAVSIAMVLYGHVAGTRYGPTMDIRRFVGDYANLGVHVFFVISGYLITSLLLEEHKEFGKISLSHFYIRRALRILPAFLTFMTGLVFARWLGLIELPWGALVHALTYTVNYQVDRPWVTGHLWSLSVEEQFYLLWPLALVALAPARAMRLAVLVMAVAPASRLAMRVFAPQLDLEIFTSMADALAAGCILAGLRDRLHSEKLYLTLVESKIIALLLVAVVVACNSMRGYALGDAFGTSIISVSLAIILDHVVSRPNETVGKLLNSTPFVFVGALSYSLYLWQQPFLNRHSNSVYCAFPLNLLFASALACASYYGLELPVLRLRKRFARAKYVELIQNDSTPSG